MSISYYDNEKAQSLGFLCCTRILTSGLGANVNRGAKLLKYLQGKYGHRIEILAGAGISTENIEKIIFSPKLIKEIAFAGQQKFIKLYNNEAQMKPRLELLKSFISN